MELKKKYKALKDIAIKASPDNEAYIQFFEEEFNRQIKKMLEEISVIK